jgi:hypothetical protein
MVGLARGLALGSALTVGLLLAVVFVGIIVDTEKAKSEARPIELDRPPKSVLALEREARKDVEDDATNAGLEALQHAKSSLTASLTGGLKRDLQNMKAGDDALLKHIESVGTKPTKKSSSKVCRPLHLFDYMCCTHCSEKTALVFFC